MDSDHLDFPDGSFDMIINRNVFWIMQDPVAVYKEWFRVLRPGGRLLYFDGAHPARDKDYDFKSYDLKNLEREEDGKPVKTSVTKENYDEARGWKTELILSYVERPAWDIENAAKVGFVDIDCEDFSGVPSRPRIGDAKRAYPMFRFVATRP
jgi:SAM-dependent methyltransferase